MNKQHQRNAPTEKRRLFAPRASQSDGTNSTVPVHEHEGTSRSTKASPNAKRSKLHQRLDAPRSSKNKVRPSIGARTSARIKATPSRRPLQSRDAGAAATETNVSPTRYSPQKMAMKQPFHEGVQDENVEIDMTGVSLCDSDFFGSNDQQLIAGIHDEMAQGTFDDTTAEF